MTQAALFHTCTTFFKVFGAPKRVWALKMRFGATFALWRPRNVKKRRTRVTKKRCWQDWRTFSSKVLLGSTWGTLGPAGAEAGWLAAEGSELRAEGRGPRAEGRGLRADGGGLGGEGRGLGAEGGGLGAEGSELWASGGVGTASPPPFLSARLA